MKKFFLILGALIIAVVCLFGGDKDEKAEKNLVEKTAEQAIVATLENDIEKYFSLCSDEYIEYEMKRFDVPTQKMLIHEYEKFFGGMQTSLTNQLGKNWKYKIEIIDAYNYVPETNSEYFSLYNGEFLMEVAYEIDFTGKKFLKKIKEHESGKIKLVKRGEKWLVIY